METPTSQNESQFKSFSSGSRNVVRDCTDSREGEGDNDAAEFMSAASGPANVARSSEFRSADSEGRSAAAEGRSPGDSPQRLSPGSPQIEDVKQLRVLPEPADDSEEEEEEEQTGGVGLRLPLGVRKREEAGARGRGEDIDSEPLEEWEVESPAGGDGPLDPYRLAQRAPMTLLSGVPRPSPREPLQQQQHQQSSSSSSVSLPAPVSPERPLSLSDRQGDVGLEEEEEQEEEQEFHDAEEEGDGEGVPEVFLISSSVIEGEGDSFVRGRDARRKRVGDQFRAFVQRVSDETFRLFGSVSAICPSCCEPAVSSSNEGDAHELLVEASAASQSTTVVPRGGDSDYAPQRSPRRSPYGFPDVSEMPTTEDETTGVTFDPPRQRVSAEHEEWRKQPDRSGRGHRGSLDGLFFNSAAAERD